MSEHNSKRSVEIAAQSGGWIEVKQGERVRIVDIEGSQIADTFAVNSTDTSEFLSVRHTRAALRRLFPKIGDAFYTNRMRPILTLVEDTSPGAHDMLWICCDAQLYASLGVEGDHPNCQANFHAAAAQAGWQPQETPDPVNLFQNTKVNAEGELVTETALSRAGDAVTLRAEMDLILVATACAFDILPINGERCTGIRLQIVVA